MLAPDAITLRIAGEVHPLRASLRAGIRLERRFGLAKLAEGLATGSISILSEILVECGAPENVFHAVTLGDALPEAQIAAASLLTEIFGLDHESDAEPKSEGKGVTHAEAFHRLYQAGTGTMGWSPKQTLSASPTEITEAVEGRHDFVGDILKAVFGSPKKDDGDEPPPHANQNESATAFLDRADAARDTSALNSLRGLERAA